MNMLIKKLVASTAHYSGGLGFLSHQRLRNQAFVLMYHRVLQIPSEHPFIQPGMYVTTSTFEWQIAYLKENYRVLHLDELWARVKSGKKVGGCCAITFDDGWHDNYTEALPILVKYKVPATIFLATGFIGTDRIFWSDEISPYLANSLGKTQPGADAPGVVRMFWENHQHSRGKVTLEKGIEILKKFSSVEREEILEYFRAHNHEKRFSGFHFLKWDEINHMQASGLIRFGVHTVNHEILDRIPLQVVIEEIANSREHIKSRLGNDPLLFAYPNGNYTIDVQKVLQDQGFEAAVTTKKGFINESTSSFEIPRIGMHDDVSCTISLFVSRIISRLF